MKAVKLIAPILMACAMVFMSFSVRAICPVQQTSIFYINGADNEEEDTRLSADRLRQALKRKTNPECVTINYAYNQTQEGITDILEAFRQESLEEILTATNFWEMFERLVPARPAFSNLMGAAVLSDPINLLDTEILRQINEHLNTLYRVSPHKDNQLLFVGHSAGNYFANEERLAMTETERNRTKIVSVATLANNVAGASGPYTTVFEDGYVSSFAGALVPNLNNVGECTDDWACHGWLSSYMVPGSNSRAKIVDDIIAALPTTPPPVFATIQGHIFQSSGSSIISVGAGIRVELLGAGSAIAQTVTDGNGFYRMGVPACDRTDDVCTVLAASANLTFLGFADIFSFSQIAGTTVTVDVTMFPF